MGEALAKFAESSDVPLVIDVDGTLVRSDTLIESLARLLGAAPLRVFSLPIWLRHGKAEFKRRVAATAPVEPGSLVLNESVVDVVHAARRSGRQVYLASGADESVVRALAAHIGGVDGLFASNGTVNLTGTRKAKALVSRFGVGGFDYIGNEGKDLPSWREARRAFVANSLRGLTAKVRSIDPDAVVLDARLGTPLDYLRALRPHHWAKNLLIFLPLVAAHVTDARELLAAVGAFVAFSLGASGTYLINDILDLTHDRQHVSKRKRPLASGAVPLLHGFAMAPLIILAGLIVAAAMSWGVLGMLVIYLAVTTIYSTLLKHRMFLDVVTLAMLYTIRTLAGAVAISVSVSPWFLAFSLFFFLLLAIVKRCTELRSLAETDGHRANGRNYHVADLPVLAGLGAAGGFAAVVVLALYLNSSEVMQRYTSPGVLWLLCPLLIYWQGRILLLANRGEVDDDPVVFALSDRTSSAVGAACAVVFLLAL